MTPGGSEWLADRLAGALEPHLGPVRIEGLERLSGGASRETWRFDAVRRSGDAEPLVLRRDPPGRPSAPGAMWREAAAIRASGAAGLAVPPVLLHSDGPDLWGSAGIVMRRVEGETVARRILRDPEYAGARAALAGDCGRFLGGLHRLDPTAVPGLERHDPLALYRDHLDALGDMAAPSPTFEYALRWLASGRPAPGPEVIVHGDFRLGNLIVGPEGLRAVLDWELVHLGDPVEDLGWLCVKAWRFGASLPVGGFATRAELLDAYHGAGGSFVEPEVLRWWEVFNTLKWGVACMGQAAVHLSGAVRSVELAAIGRRVCEQEWDLLLLLGGGRTAADSSTPSDPSITAAPGLHGRPTVAELLAAVREFLTDDVMPGTSGRLSFHARVAANVVAMVERQLGEDASVGERRTRDLASLGAESEAELAAAIRDGVFDDRDDEVLAVLASGVAAKVAVANPRYFLA